MSHEALGKLAKSHNNNPNVWFVGVTPRRNPELVVAVLWQNGGFSYYPARIGARIVAAYIEKKRRLENNLQTVKASKPVEVGAVWSGPRPGGRGNATQQLGGGISSSIRMPIRGRSTTGRGLSPRGMMRQSKAKRPRLKPASIPQLL